MARAAAKKTTRSAKNVEKQKKKARRVIPKKKTSGTKGNTLSARSKVKKDGRQEARCCEEEIRTLPGCRAGVRHWYFTRPLCRTVCDDLSVAICLCRTVCRD